MRSTLHSITITFFILISFLYVPNVSAQIPLKDFVVFGNNGVQVGTSSEIVSGKTGSNINIQSTGTASFGGSLHSNGQINLANSNTVNGNVTAANGSITAATVSSPATSGATFQMGSNAYLSGRADINGNVVIGGGTINGPVVYSGTYSGPDPLNGKTQGSPTFPALPNLPVVLNPPYSGGSNITNTQTISPGSWGAMTLGGGKTITFSTPGIYIFSSIKNSGNFNKFVFNFPNTDGRFRIFITGDVDLYKINVGYTGSVPGYASLSNADLAARIFMQVIGTGSTSANGTDAWTIANGASGNNQSTWLGTVWAPNGNIDVGSGSSQSKIIGALWSGKTVTIQSGVSITQSVYLDCSPSVSAGPDKNINCDNPTATLTGSCSGTNPQYSWSKVGGSIAGPTNTASITVNRAGTYVLTAYSLECTAPATDTVIVTSTKCILPYYPPPLTGKDTSKIGAELTSLYENYGNVLDDGKTLFIIVNGKVLIDVIVLQGNYATVKNMLLGSNYGMTDTVSNGPNSLIITGLYPISNLLKFNQSPMRDLISFVRPSYPPVSNSGLIQTQGDSAMRTNFVRNGFHLSGDSVKVGVLSDSYNTLPNNDVNNGDLPGLTEDPVQVLLDYPYGQRSDEGRAMLQIVHDVAPKAKLAFRTGFITAGDMAQGIRDLVGNQCNVIVDDITFITEPFFRTGVIASAIHDASLRGVHYVTAAGNFGVKSYEGVFNPSTATLPAGIYGQAHNFGGGDIFQSDSVKGTAAQPGVYTLVLQWQDDIYSLGSNPGASADLDAYAFDNMGNIIGFNRINIAGDPTEVLTFVATSNTIVNIMIVNASATTTPIRFKYVVFRGDLKINEYNLNPSTIVGQANAPEAITVGAALYSNTPAFGVYNITKSSFSSVGGTMYNGAVAQKPDLVGPNGVNTSVNFGSIDYEGDGIPNFFGTSAAAPHVAGAVALMVEARRRFYRDTLSPAQIKTILKNNAIDMDVRGFDLNTGTGFVQVDSSVRTMANPTPQINGIRLVDSSLALGAQPMQIIVSGSYLSSNTQVLLGKDTLQSAILNSSELNVTVPIFSSTQNLYLYTKPRTLTQTDGGLSNAWVLNGVVKKNVVVTADNKIRRYGENNPTFTATVTVDGQPTTLSLADLGLTGLTFSTLATAASSVGFYYIRPTKTFDSTGADASYLQQYNYSFVDGRLTIEKMPLTITPNSQTIDYGDALTNVTYNYQFNKANVADSTQLLNIIKLYHQSFTPSNALAVVKNFSAVQADGSTLTASDIASMNMIASFQALKNSRAFQVVNNKLVPTTDVSVFNLFYVIDVASQSLYNYKLDPATASLVNAYPGLTPKAILGENALLNQIARINTNGSLVQMVNGSLVQMVNGTSNTMAPIVNGQLVQMVNGQLVQLVNGSYVPIPNSSLVQLVNGQLVQLVNGSFVAIPNGSLVQLVNGSLVQMVNNQIEQLLNGSLVQLVNGSLVQLVNGQLVQMVNGSPQPIPNGSLVQMVNTQLVQMVNGALAPVPNGSLVQLVNGSLVQLVNGQLVQMVNANGVSGTNNRTAAIVDQGDITAQNGWLGAMFGVNMITGLDVGQQKLIPGVFINENFDVTYNLGTVTINAIPLSIKANKATKVYGDTLVFTGKEFSIASGSLIQGDSIAAVKLTSPGTSTKANAGKYLITPANAVGGTGTNINDYSITYVPDTLTVTARPITVTADAKTKVYGDSDPTFTYQVTSGARVNNDPFSGSLSRAPGQNSGTYAITQGTLTLGTNYNLSFVGNNLIIAKASLTVSADNKTKVYGDPNPALTASYTGFKYTDNTSVLSGSVLLSTTATTASFPGTYPITVDSNNISAANYKFIGFTAGVLTITDKTSCLLTHSKFTNFGSTPTGPASLWVNIEIKVSGQLSALGDYIMFSGGGLTLSGITANVVSNTIKRGVVVAANVPAPISYFDSTQDMFITKVPVGFSSTSDIFISGGIVSASNGFTSNKSSSTTLKGIFYSNRNFSDQWSYAMAAYKKSTGDFITYKDLANTSGTIVSINGDYRAGTPSPWLSYIVSGGSGNGGNNYTGSSSSLDNFTACQPGTTTLMTFRDANPIDRLQSNQPVSLGVYPNPASSNVTVSFVTSGSSASILTLFNANGIAVQRLYNGSTQAGRLYQKNINTSMLASGVYFIRMQDEKNSLIKRLVIAR